PYKSNWGKYDPAVYRGDKGDVASNDTIVNSVDIGNANIFGHVATGPGGTVDIGSSGAIGSHTWQAAGNTGKQTGWVTDDSNFTLPQTDLPYASGTALGGPGDFATVTYNVSTNAVTSSSTYPNPVPWSGVTTNIASWSILSSVPAPPH